ncbi:bacillithiol biosynthesis cysteine-adding enzyme BshC [Roseivirga sp. E12]|uniref:bacillithiol biosynthesis cysteine-adding enzyme BshC n=1 Tax=Roseivirga sp. E12 TaxID=2819237 RepID=UPI001ABCC525|nr:bacillithiol biosynthesis cysteine-adding enzyme BshC [Roseivirga sp. E12]MBO3699222.1 bacillithiol biosynthesis cysteine-adding enzyme BshC [Roseivirga sp. E12]
METLEKTDCLLTKIEFEKTNSFSKFFLDYISGHNNLLQFHNGLPTPENLIGQIDKRNFPSKSREVLYASLKSQYEGTEISEGTLKNLENLQSDNTYTITTGHQLNVFTGPLYVIYKIVSVIRACEELKKLRPDCNFVPVYWMASEDHDFDEINHFRFNGQKFSWDTDQVGAVGKFETKSISPIFDKIIGMPDFFRQAYLKEENLASAVRFYMNHLFGDQGLIIIDADDRALKTLFTPVITSDIFDHTPEKLASKTTSEIESKGYKTQVFPREINFFYLKENLRSRIVRTSEGYEVLDSDISFSEESIRQEIDNHPERFSPNVVLRPLYQEFLLPNLAYVGGPSELVYWLQLKGIFDHFEVSFPLLMPRNFAGIMTHGQVSKLTKSGLTIEDLFKEENALVKEKVVENTAFKMDLDEQRERIRNLFLEAKEQATAVDATLEKLVLAELRKSEKSLEKIEHKILKAERSNQEVLVNRIYALKEALFPGGSPQERKDNFLNFYMNNPNFIDSCMEAFDPFDYRFHMIQVNE